MVSHPCAALARRALIYAMHFLPRLLALLLALCLVAPARAAEADFLPGVKRIVFLGDSITYSGQYVDAFETFLFLRFPDRRFEIINVGLPSETVSGLSEDGHAGGQFPRPDLHERLDRVLAKAKPDLIFACYGMNDGIYLPFDEGRFAKFRDGMERLRAKAKAAGAEVIHLTPPTFHPLAARNKPGADGQPPAKTLGGYNEVLDRYAAWLLDQRAKGWRVIDLHGPMNAFIETQRKTNPDFVFANDGVHANEAGHELIAEQLIAGLAPGEMKFWTKMDGFHVDGNGEQSIDLKKVAELRKTIRQRGRILADAWLNDTGHLRPGMAKGLPLDEAQAKAAELEKQIRDEAKQMAPRL